MNFEKELAQLARDYVKACNALSAESVEVGSEEHITLFGKCEYIYGKMEILVEKEGE